MPDGGVLVSVERVDRKELTREEMERALKAYEDSLKDLGLDKPGPESWPPEKWAEMRTILDDIGRVLRDEQSRERAKVVLSHKELVEKLHGIPDDRKRWEEFKRMLSEEINDLESRDNR